jgi:hypothetical protein
LVVMLWGIEKLRKLLYGKRVSCSLSL